MFSVPVRLLEGRTDLNKLTAELTAQYFNPQTGETKPVRLYRWRRFKTWLAMPRTFARKRFPDLWAMALARTTKPRSKPGTYKKAIQPRNPEQAAFMAAIKAKITEAINDNVIIDLQINAMTGTGKTVAAIKSIADLQLAPILVIVHQNRVKEQWRGSIPQKKGYKFFFGEDWVSRNVGVVQQELCDYKGRAVVIAMGPSLISRRYPREFYEQFGIIVIDELHKFAAPMLSQVLSLFPAAVRIGMTATEKKGAMRKVVTYNLGEPAIISKQKAMKPRVIRIRYSMPFNGGKRFDNANSLRTILGRSKQRNELLAQLIYQRGYERGRQCLGLSDRTDQLLWMKKRLIELGVDEAEIGVYVDKYRTGKTKLTGKIMCTRTGQFKHFRGLPGFKSPAAAEAYVRKLGKELFNGQYIPYTKIAPEFAKVSAEEYDRIENSCSIVLATYGIFDVAIDISRLDWG